jgi:ribosomal protein S13
MLAMNELEALKEVIRHIERDVYLNEILLLDSDYEIQSDVNIQITHYIKKLKKIKKEIKDGE